MAAFLERVKNEPAVVIGIIGMAAVSALQSLAGNEVISADIVTTVGNLIGTVQAPGPATLLLAGVVTRFFVYGPKSAEALRAEPPPGWTPPHP